MSWRQRVVVEGRITAVQVGTVAGKSLEAQLFDETGGVRLLFMGRTSIPGIEPGKYVRASGTVGEYKGHLALANPTYELVDEPCGPGRPRRRGTRLNHRPPASPMMVPLPTEASPHRLEA